MINYSEKSRHDGDPNGYSRWHEAALSLLSIKNKDVMDIGCGSGGFLLHIKDMAKSVTGIDPNKENCRLANGNGLKVLNEYPEKVFGLENSFDVVSCFEVIEHLYDHHSIIGAASKMLRSGGYAVISTPNAFNIMRQIKFVFFGEHHDTLMDPTRQEFPEHIRSWSYGMMQRLCNSEKDLRVEKVYGVSLIFGRAIVFKNKFLIKHLSQHLLVIIKKP